MPELRHPRSEVADAALGEGDERVVDGAAAGAPEHAALSGRIDGELGPGS
jgi:hypothetical protein